MKARNYSRKREAILAKIRSTNCHPTADWVFGELRGEYPDLSLATIYRNLALFKEEGSIVSVGIVGGQERFDGDTEPHGHFVCRECRAVIDIDLPVIDPARAAMHPEDARRHQIDRVDLTAYGYCAECVKTV